jgi:hypothetical protein
MDGKYCSAGTSPFTDYAVPVVYQFRFHDQAIWL